MEYKFVGRDGSMGYKKGKVYILGIQRLSKWDKFVNWLSGLPTIDLIVIGIGHSDCPYTEAGFNKNWKKA